MICQVSTTLNLSSIESACQVFKMADLLHEIDVFVIKLVYGLRYDFETWIFKDLVFG